VSAGAGLDDADAPGVGADVDDGHGRRRRVLSRVPPDCHGGEYEASSGAKRASGRPARCAASQSPASASVDVLGVVVSGPYSASPMASPAHLENPSHGVAADYQVCRRRDLWPFPKVSNDPGRVHLQVAATPSAPSPSSGRWRRSLVTGSAASPGMQSQSRGCKGARRRRVRYAASNLLPP
jgi:hypothetical protein